ncbi:MAG: hypothetical protein J6V90_12550 [Treponema sp.]|nr:hypothetical protein [Treponema sp.]
MEKHSTRAKKRLAVGLLAAALSLCGAFRGNNLYSQNSSALSFSWADAEKLEVLPKDDIFFTNNEAQYILKIPKALPSDVQTELPNFPEGVTFNSSKKSDYITKEGNAGTEVDLWFTFRQTGTFTFSPLVIYVKGRRYTIKFKPVEVYENPRTILPRLIVVFDNGETITPDAKKTPTITLESDKAARFTIYLQYALQAQQFAWNIPKDSLFTEIKRYTEKNAPRKSSDFTTEKVPISYFEWTPFTTGTTSLPEIKMMVTAYSGRSVYLTTPECIVTIVPQKKDAQAKNVGEQDSVYAYAWTENTGDEKTKKAKTSSPLDCAQIARLRSLERRALLALPKIRVQRIEAERAVGIKTSENEANYCLFFILLGANVLLIVAAILFDIFKKRFEAAVLGVAALGMLFLSILAANAVLKRYGVIVGGEISPIPEESAITKSAVNGGSRVQIKEETQDWYYIVYNENGGWIKKENLAVIK